MEKDPNGMDPHKPGAKLDAGKQQPWLCIGGFARAMEAVADVTTTGAIKYTRNGWMEVEDGQARYMEGFGRHMLKLGKGETVDPTLRAIEGRPILHKAQMIWNLLASLELELREVEAAALRQKEEQIKNRIFSGIGDDRRVSPIPPIPAPTKAVRDIGDVPPWERT